MVDISVVQGYQNRSLVVFRSAMDTWKSGRGVAVTVGRGVGTGVNVEALNGGDWVVRIGVGV
jgi:hypothetical protein